MYKKTLCVFFVLGKDITIITNYTKINVFSYKWLLKKELAEKPPIEEPIKFNITLINGWNLISFPLNLTNKIVSNVMSSFAYSSIFTKYGGLWDELNLSDSFNESKAYWVDSSASQILTINGTEFNINITLTKGWNFIGYPYLTASLPNETLKGTNYSVVYSYTNSNWSSNVKGRNETLNNLNQFNPGQGYWVKVN